ncbi:RDD family protein [Myxococcota bacterium]|nr:RDD family protein [Myxococcota bacterium]MBU1431993.1 RDD family protein [Myxococcota bacterium]MBU1897031.1 RDD family protein [Myxococcota bacterium]
MPLDTVARIEAPEQLHFDHHVVGPWRRFNAYLIDTLIRGFILFILTLTSGLTFGAETGALLLLFFTLEWGWFVFFETLFNGQSPGKRALKLRVVKGDGRPLRFGDAVLRNLLRAADILPLGYCVGGVVSAFDPRFRRLGDLVADTMVVSIQAGLAYEPLKLDPPPTRQELEGLPARPDLRPEELMAIERLLRRAEQLNPHRRQELARLLTPRLTERLGLEPTDDPERRLALLWFLAQGEPR